MNKNTVIVDIDGTIAKIGDRLKYIQQPVKDYKSFYSHCDEDEPILDVIKLVRILAHWGCDIVFCSGREGSSEVYAKTLLWLRDNVSGRRYHRIILREEGDHRPDVEVKPELLKKYGYSPENIWFILEDRDSMVAEWRRLGYTCFQVNDGKF